MKLIKNFLKVILIYIFILILPFSTRADDLGTVVKTGDRGLIGLIIAFMAFIVTAFITVKLTRQKNKLNKK